MVSVIFLIILIILFTSIVGIAATVKRVEKDTTIKTESFEKMIRTVYFYLIMIIMICILIFGTVGFFNSLMNIYLPEKTVQTAIEAKSAQNNNIQDVITSLTAIVIALPTFAYFSKNVKKENKI